MKVGINYLWYAVIAVAAVIVIVAVTRGPMPSQEPSMTATPSGTPGASTTPTTRPSPGASKTPVSTAPGTYGDAVTAYANRRIQFDQYCQAVPNSFAIKKGLAIMLDNRSGDARTFAVDGATFTIPGYGWKILIPQVTSVPKTLYIDCGSARNVGTIIVQ